MTKVLILGATGYLGNNLANILVRNGQHTVYGVARTATKAKQLAAQEIIPVLCPDPINEPSAYLSLIRSAHIDIVVDVAGANDGTYKILEDIKSISQERLDNYTKSGIKGPKLGFIYCSGSWVHGSTEKRVNDLDLVGPEAIAPPAPLVTWRVALENSILNSSDILDVMILRPALLYGREHTIWTSYIAPLYEAARNQNQNQNQNPETIHIPLDPISKPALVHVDDAAVGFERAIEKLPLLSGTGVYPVFDLMTSQESMKDIIDALAQYFGFEGRVELVGHGGDLFNEAMSTTFRGSSIRARQVLGWEPKRGGFVRDMDVYAAAFAASR